MNILFIFPYPMIPSVGGVQRVTDTLARELTKLGDRVYYVSYFEKYDGDELACPQFFLDLSSGNWEFKYKELLDLYKIEVVICQNIFEENIKILSVTPASLKKVTVYHVLPFATLHKEKIIAKYFVANTSLQKIKKTICMYIPWIMRLHNTRAEAKAIRKVLEVSDKLCLLSERFFPRLNRMIPNLQKTKLCAINNPNTFDVVNSDKDICKSRVLLFVGRICITKNLYQFLDIWSKVSQKYPNWSAKIVGDGPDLQSVKEYSKKISVPNVSFEGQQTNVARYYQEAATLCLPTMGEGWGMSITEAMTYGCVPFVYDSFESVYDIIDNGVNGVISAAFDVDKMAQNICDIIGNEELLLDMSYNAVEKVKEFDANKTALKWQTLLRNL